MDTPSVPGLLDAWERGQAWSAPARGLLLLHAAFPGRDQAELAGLTLGERNRLLLGLRVRLFGTDLDGLATCGGCGETLETQLPLPALAAGPATGPAAGPGSGPSSGPPAEPDIHELADGGWRVRYRLPTAADVMELPVDDDDPARWLLVRCVAAAEHDGRPVAAAEVPDDVAALVARAMGDLDPDGVLELVVGCPQCGGTSTVPLEPAAFLWAELDQWAWRVLAEVRDLAIAYGWAEHDILALSPWRRQAYLELLPA